MSQTMQLQAKKPKVGQEQNISYEKVNWRQLRCVQLAWPAHQEDHLEEFSNDNSVGLNEMLVSAILCCLSELIGGYLAQRGGTSVCHRR